LISINFSIPGETLKL